jgi:hypothetical protein
MEGVGVSENQDNLAADHISISESGPLAGSRAITKLPVQDLDRARAFYQDKLGLTPVEEREGGLRYLCAAGSFICSSQRGRLPELLLNWDLRLRT